jgi:hypothetical protein
VRVSTKLGELLTRLGPSAQPEPALPGLVLVIETETASCAAAPPVATINEQSTAASPTATRQNLITGI